MATVLRLDEGPHRSLFQGLSCTFGVFDGVHVGHQYLIRCAIDSCAPKGESAVITFDIDPDELFHPKRLRKLLRNDDRIDLLAKSGVDYVIVIPFTPRFAALEPREFLRETFGDAVPSHLHVGEDLRFGVYASGTVEDLLAWGGATGCEVDAHRLVSSDGRPISATRIRMALGDCLIEEANRLLGRPYFLREIVRKGRGEGARFGFRTANLQVKPHDQVLGEGVYAAWVTVEGTRCKAAVSVGVSPTFEERAVANMEVHILDYEGDLVGRALTVEFVHFLRPMIKFDSTEELIATVMDNINWVREHLN